uniref:DNA polymerase IV n=1 Tax=Lygus hesperus TaxID=30085 RepID=A0A0A9W4U0_LYGHE
MLAKVASSTCKPNQQTLVLPHEVTAFLQRCKLHDIPGFGPRSIHYANLCDFHHIHQLQQLSQLQIQQQIERARRGLDVHDSSLIHPASLATSLYNLSRGIDHTVLVPKSAPKSISASKCLNTNSNHERAQLLIWLCSRLASRIFSAYSAHSLLPRTFVLGADTTALRTKLTLPLSRHSISVSDIHAALLPVAHGLLTQLPQHHSFHYLYVRVCDMQAATRSYNILSLFNSTSNPSSAAHVPNSHSNSTRNGSRRQRSLSSFYHTRPEHPH